MDSLKEYGFFTFAKVDGKKQQFQSPTDYFLDYQNSTLVLHFTLPFKTPIKTKQLAVEIFDPTYFVDFALENSPSASRRARRLHHGSTAERRSRRSPETRRGVVSERKQQ